MAVVTTAALKALFETNDPLIESSFESLIDSLVARASSPVYDTVTDMLAEANTAIGSEGAVWRAAQFSYKQAAADASDHHLTTAGGQKLYVLPDQSGRYNLNAFNVTTATANVQDAINVVLRALPTHSTLYLPAGEYLVAKTTTSGIKPGSSGFNSGILAAIYLDKEGQALEGDGYGTHINGQAGALNCIMVRASHARVRRLRAGNCTGQLSTGESAAANVAPSNFDQGSANGADIENVHIEDCDFYACDSGVSIRCETDGQEAATVMYYVSRAKVADCRIQYRRQGVEAFNTNHTEVKGCSFRALDFAPLYNTSRILRNIGSFGTLFHHNESYGFDSTSNAVYGVQTSQSSYYSIQALEEHAYDLICDSNRFYDYGSVLSIAGSEGAILFTNNICERTPITDTAGTYVCQMLTGGLKGTRTVASLENKLTCVRLDIANNQAQGYSQFFFGNGRSGAVRIKGNVHISNERSDARLVNYVMKGDADAAIEDLETCAYLEVADNVCIHESGKSSSEVVLSMPFTSGLASSAEANECYVSNNVTTRPIASQAFIAISGDPTVIVPDSYSNRNFETDVHGNQFDPPFNSQVRSAY